MPPQPRSRSALGNRHPAKPPDEQAGKPDNNVDNTQASKPASESTNGGPERTETQQHTEGMQWGVNDLVGGIDPEEDRAQTGLRIPKYVFEALRLHSTLTHQKQQDIAADAVKTFLPDDLLDGTYRRLYGRERRH